MPQITIRIDETADAELWAAIRAIPAGQRTARLKRILETGFRIGGAGILERLEDLERRMSEWESGLRTTPVPSPVPLTSAAGPVPTPPGWKESLANFGAFDD